MNVSDISKVLESKTEILFLVVPVMLMYVFHLSADLKFLLLGILSMFFPAITLVHEYYSDESRVFVETGGGVLEWDLFFITSVLIYIVSYPIGLFSLYTRMDNGDLLTVMLFSIVTFLTILGFCWGMFQHCTQEFHEES